MLLTFILFVPILLLTQSLGGLLTKVPCSNLFSTSKCECQETEPLSINSYLYIIYYIKSVILNSYCRLKLDNDTEQLYRSLAITCSVNLTIISNPEITIAKTNCLRQLEEKVKQLSKEHPQRSSGCLCGTYRYHIHKYIAYTYQPYFEIYANCVIDVHYCAI